MPKAYWVAHIQVHDADAYAVYAKGATEAFEKYGARPLARGGRFEALEGAARPRNVVVEFASMEAARACYDSPEYQAAKAHREGHADIDLIIVEAVA